MAIPLPRLSVRDVLSEVIRTAETQRIERIDRCLIYAPDAIGAEAVKRDRSLFAEVLKRTPIEILLLSVVPPKTPVCYSSMFTGAEPELHGIRKYEQRILKCDTIFDVLIRAGKKPAVVAVAGSSIDRMFRGRGLDYFSEDYDQQVTSRTIQLIESNEHDFIVAYHQEYDDVLHETTPESPTAVKAMKNHINSFAEIADSFDRSCKEYDRLLVFAPDHGAHVDRATGKGVHGQNIPADMQVLQFYGVRRSGDNRSNLSRI